MSESAWKEMKVEIFRTVYWYLMMRWKLLHYIVSSSENNLHKNFVLGIECIDMRYNNEMKTSVVYDNFKCTTFHIKTSSS
jgi:hypothetical protein